MKKIHLAILIILACGIAASLWYATQPGVAITYGTPAETEKPAQLDNSDVVVDVPLPSTASAQAIVSTEAPVASAPEVRQTRPVCESVRITVGTASYVPCVASEVTVLAAMQEATKDGLVFTGREYPGLGFFVESINGTSGGDGYYWFLYINDESSSTGASGTLVRPGDIVEWRYKQSY